MHDLCDIVKNYDQPGDTTNVHFDRSIKFEISIRQDKLDCYFLSGSSGSNQLATSVPYTWYECIPLGYYNLVDKELNTSILI